MKLRDKFMNESELSASSQVTESRTLMDRSHSTNEYPIIGVLAQEIAYTLELIYPQQYKSFIAASYVKFIEGGGARVVPIWIDKPREYYEDIMSKINGSVMTQC